MLSANWSCTRAPVSRANCSWRAVSACQALGVPQLLGDVMALPATANHSQCAWSSVARVRREHQLARPAQRRRGGRVPLASTARRTPRAARRSRPRASRAAGARAARPRAIVRDPAGPSRSPAYIAAPSASRCVLRARPTVRAARGVCAAPARCARRLAAAELVEGDLPAQHLDAGAPELVERLGVDRAEQPRAPRRAHRHRAWRRPPPAAARLGATGRATAWRRAPGTRRRRRARRAPARGPRERSSSTATSLVRRRRRLRPDATHGGPGRPADRSPPPGRGAPPGAPRADADR